MIDREEFGGQIGLVRGMDRLIVVMNILEFCKQEKSRLGKKRL